MTTISAGTTSTTAYVATPDTTGTLVLKTGASDTTALTLDASQNATLAGTLTVPGAISASGGVVGEVTGNASTATALTTASGSAPSYSARAWVNFNGTGTVAIRASGNVSSITDNATADYTVNFTTAMADANYAAVITAGMAATQTDGNMKSCVYTQTASAVRVLNRQTTNGVADPTIFNVTVFR